MTLVRPCIVMFCVAVSVGCGSREVAPLRSTSAMASDDEVRGRTTGKADEKKAGASTAIVDSEVAKGARAQEVFPLEADFGSYAAIDAPLPLAEKEADFACAPNLAGTFAPLRSIEITTRTRLWASTGPEFARSIESTRFLLALTREGTSDAVLGCGATLALDLEPGRYWIRGRARSTQFVEGDEAPGLRGFAVRLSKEGDMSCPTELPLRGIHDWEGEFPFEVTRERIDGDTEPDYAIRYQLAFMNPGTRLVLAAPYPSCAKVVMDLPALAKSSGGRTNGFRDYVLSGLSFHPIEIFGGRYVFGYEGRFDASVGAYTEGRFLDCREAYVSESPALDRDRERLCVSVIRQREKDSFASDLLVRWLDGTAEERKELAGRADATSESATKLLRALDEEGFRFMTREVHACEFDGNTKALSHHLELYPKGALHGAFTRELFVLETKKGGAPSVIAAVRDEEPCPMSDESEDVEPFVSGFLEAEWSEVEKQRMAEPTLRATHGLLKKAFAAERIEMVSHASCASAFGVSATPSWIYTALVTPEGPKGSERSSVPVYLLVEKRGDSLRVIDAPKVRPAHCEP